MPLRRDDADFQAEIEAHILIERDRLIAEGMAPSDAHAAARRAFGNVTSTRERFYEAQRWTWWTQLIQDLRLASRLLWKAPAFTIAASLTIALGVGANTAVFSLMDAVLLKSLPVRSPEELVFPEVAGAEGPTGAPPYPCLMRLRAEVTAFAGLAAFSADDELRVEINGRPEQMIGQLVSGNYFDVLGVRALRGRLLEPRDESLNPPVAVISHRLWQQRFGSDPDVLGKTISSGKRSYTIVGIMPEQFRGLSPGRSADLLLPITTLGRDLADSGARGFHAVARIKPGLREAAQAQAQTVFQSFLSQANYPSRLVRDQFQHLQLRPAARGMDGLRTRFSKPLYVLAGIAVMVLLMATVNLTNLLLVRGIGRRREFAIRLATGAGRGRLVRQLLTETLLLFGLSAIVGVAFAAWGVHIIESLLAEGRRAITIDAHLNWHVLLFCIAIALAAGLLAGSFPAWRAFRTNPEEAMKEGQARTGESRRSAMLTHALVALQVAISLVLLVGAVTFVRTLANLRNLDAGFRNGQVLTMSIELPDGFVRRSSDVWTRVLQSIRSSASVGSAAMSVLTPLSGRDRGASVKVRGFEPSQSQDSSIRINQVSDRYFETLGIPLLRGRLLTEQDAEQAPYVALINESAARKFFADRDPIGQTLEFPRTGTPGTFYRVVGVVGNTSHTSLREAPPPFAFIPVRQPLDFDRRLTLIVSPKPPNAETALLESVRGAVSTVDPQLMISEVITMRRQVDSSLLTERLLSGLSGAFGILAIVLAAVGLYGVLSYRIGQQRRSLGIRMALGASAASVSRNVLRESGATIAAGIACGLPVAIIAARAAETLLWGFTAGDPAIYVLAIVLLVSAGFASAWIPARRASSIDPADVLRHN